MPNGSSSSSTGHAGLSPASWVAGVSAATAWRICRRVLVIAAGFTIFYLIAANVVLKTRWMRDAINAAPSVKLEYASAVSWWPGRVHVSDLAIRAEDHNVQFEVKLASATVNIGLLDLLSKRFRVFSVDATGTGFRFRHKVAAVNDQGRRLAAYPPIAGFADPPLYSGEAPSGEGNKELWKLAIEGVNAELSELWILEYRYTGAGLARGAFHIDPGRSFEVFPASVHLSGGQLHIGDQLLVERFNLEAWSQVRHTDVQVTIGNEMLRGVDGRLDLNASGLSLAAANVYIPETSGVRASGRGALSLQMSATGGQVEPGARAALSLSEMALGHSAWSGRAALELDLAVNAQRALEGNVSVPRVELTGEGERALGALERASLNLVTNPVDLAGTGLDRAALKVEALELPSLSRWLPVLGAAAPRELGGKLEAALNLAWQRQAGLSGSVASSLVGGELGFAELNVRGSGRVRAELSPREPADKVSRGRFDLDLDRLELIREGDRAVPFRASVRSSNVELDVETPQLAADAHVVVQPGSPLLHLVLGDEILRSVAKAAWSFERIDADAEIDFGERGLRFELTRATSGSLRGQGELRRSLGGDLRGAFLVSSGIGNVGVKLSGGDTETELLVADDWLARAR